MNDVDEPARFSILSSDGRMKEHAVAFLEATESWNWPETIQPLPSGLTGAITAKFLRCCISESVSLGGLLLGQFWEILETCNPLLKENVSQLRRTQSVDKEHTVRLLFQGLNREAINFEKFFNLATDILIHLGVAMWNPDGRKSNCGTSVTVSEEISLTLDELLRRAEEPDFGMRKQKALKELAYKRDGGSCLLTDTPFIRPPEINRSHGVSGYTAHIIPNSIYNKPDALKTLAIFAGTSAAEVIHAKLNTVANVVNLQYDARGAYDDFYWGIEAQEGEDGHIVYRYRNIPSTSRSPLLIKRNDGDQIKCGDKENLPGPDPTLCNVRLAVARALKMSGVVGLLEQPNDEADVSDFPHNFVASDGFADILTAKLLLSCASLSF